MSGLELETKKVQFKEQIRAPALRIWLLERLKSSGVVEFNRTELSDMLADCFLAHTPDGHFLAYFEESKGNFVQGISIVRYLSRNLHIEAGDARETWFKFRGPEDTSFSVVYAAVYKPDNSVLSDAHWERVRELHGIQYDLFYHVADKPARLRAIK